jgi:hypothetical protein
MATHKTYIVSAEHTFPQYHLNRAPVVVNYHDYREFGGKEEYSVTLRYFGCSKSYPTAHDAIRGLLQDNEGRTIQDTIENDDGAVIQWAVNPKSLDALYRWEII